MRRIMAIVVLLGVAGCSGSGIAGFGDPCSWLPEPNQEAFVDFIFDARAEGAGRSEIFGFIFTENINNVNVFNPSPTEFANCLDDMLEQVYGI